MLAPFRFRDGGEGLLEGAFERRGSANAMKESVS